jgi:hypothetical protein
MTARSVFNIGTLDNPGHADNVASITLKKTAPFRALLQIDGRRLKQKQIAEWLEDWSDYCWRLMLMAIRCRFHRQLRLFVASLFNKQHSRP